MTYALPSSDHVRTASYASTSGRHTPLQEPKRKGSSVCRCVLAVDLDIFRGAITEQWLRGQLFRPGEPLFYCSNCGPPAVQEHVRDGAEHARVGSSSGGGSGGGGVGGLFSRKGHHAHNASSGGSGVSGGGGGGSNNKKSSGSKHGSSSGGGDGGSGSREGSNSNSSGGGSVMRAIAGWFRKKDRDKRGHDVRGGVAGSEPLRLGGGGDTDEELPVTPRTERELFLCVTCAACYCRDHAWDHNYSRGDRGGATGGGGGGSAGCDKSSCSSSSAGGGAADASTSAARRQQQQQRYPSHSLFIGVPSYVSTHPAHMLSQTEWGLLLPTVLVRDVEEGRVDRVTPQPFYGNFGKLADACMPCVSMHGAADKPAHASRKTSHDAHNDESKDETNVSSVAVSQYDGASVQHTTADTTVSANNNNSSSNNNNSSGGGGGNSTQPQSQPLLYSHVDASSCNVSFSSAAPPHSASRFAAIPAPPPLVLSSQPTSSTTTPSRALTQPLSSHLVAIEQPLPRTASSTASLGSVLTAPPPTVPHTTTGGGAGGGNVVVGNGSGSYSSGNMPHYNNNNSISGDVNNGNGSGSVSCHVAPAKMCGPVYYATPSDNWSYMMWCARCSVRPVRMTGAHYDADSAAHRALRRVGQLLALLAYLRYRGVRLELPVAYLSYVRAHQQAQAASSLSSQLLLRQQLSSSSQQQQHHHGTTTTRTRNMVSLAELQNVMKSTEMMNGVLMPQLTAAHTSSSLTTAAAAQPSPSHDSTSSFVSSTTAAAIAAINTATPLPVVTDGKGGSSGGRVLLPRVEVDKLLTRMGVCGFSNTNYFCYINSVLQCVLRCLFFCQPLLRLELAASPGKLTTSLCHLLRQLRDQTYQDVLNHAADPFVTAVYKQICGDGGLFEVDQQQDAHELLITLLNGVADEFDKGKSEAEKKTSRRISFEGVLRTKVMCCVCHNEVRRNEMFMSLSVPIEASLQDSLSKLFKDSYLVGRNRYACESCFSKLSREQQEAHNAAARQQEEQRKRQKADKSSSSNNNSNGATTTTSAAAGNATTTTTTTTATSTTSATLPLHANCVYQDAVVHTEIARLGETLAVHLLRFQYSAATQSFDKITTPVKVPFELDLTPYVSRKTLKQYSEMHDFHTLLRRFRHVDEATCSRYFVEAGNKFRAACARMLQEGYDTTATTTTTTTTATSAQQQTPSHAAGGGGVNNNNKNSAHGSEDATMTAPAAAAAAGSRRVSKNSNNGDDGPTLVLATTNMMHSRSMSNCCTTTGTPLMLSPYGRVLVHRSNSAIATTTTADDAVVAASCPRTVVSSDEYTMRLLHPPTLVRRLVGIVIHRGSLDSGHYIAFVRYLDMPDTWYRCDDEDIDVVDQQTVEDAAAETYLAFYE